MSMTVCYLASDDLGNDGTCANIAPRLKFEGHSEHTHMDEWIRLGLRTTRVAGVPASKTQEALPMSAGMSSKMPGVFSLTLIAHRHRVNLVATGSGYQGWCTHI